MMLSSQTISRFLKSVASHLSGSSAAKNRRRKNCASIPVAAVCDVLESKQLLTSTLIEAIPGQQISDSSDSSVITLSDHFDDTEIDGSVVSIETPAGTFHIETFDEVTPVSAQNFLDLVVGGNYENSIFHRLEPGFVLQGGGFRFEGDETQLSSVENNGTIVNEFDNWFDPEFGGLAAGTALNVRGTLSYAKLGSDPDSATSQFFVNLNDNSENLDNQNGGFTVFARIIYDGLDVVDQLAASTVVNAGGAFTSLPVVDWEEGESVERPNLLQSTSSIVDELSYEVTVTAGGEYIDATITDGVLTVTGTEAANSSTGHATVVVAATDLAGNVVEESFRVAIGVPADLAVTGPVAVVQDLATITWQASEGAETYELWISRMQDLDPSQVETAGIVRQTGLTGTSYTVPETLESGVYRAWVRASNGEGTGAWSQPFEFVVGLSEPDQAAIGSVTALESNPLRVTVDWVAVDQAVQYQVWITDSSGQVVVNQNVADTSYVTDFDLESGESYRVWVRGVNHRFNGLWSPVQSFSVDLNTDPVTITTASSVIADSARPLIEWDSPADHDSYEIWISEVGTAGAFLQDSTTDTSYQPGSDLPDGVYQVWVRPAASTGIAWSSPIVIAVGSQAQVTGPTGTVGEAPTITWSTGIPGTTTQLWVNGPSGRVVFETGLTGTSFTVPETLPDGAYTAWVRQAPAAGGVLAWSTAFRFEVGASTVPGVPNLSVTVEGNDVTFDWDPVENAVRFELWVNSPTTTQVISETELTGTSFQGTLSESGSHRAWLRAFNADGNSGAWTAVEVFTV
ncbi:MAG: peptidylprolyl isomerase [Fuerstiella sp.]